MSAPSYGADAFQVLLGSLIVLIGVAALSFFVMRKRFKDRALIWFGVFALLYGTPRQRRSFRRRPSAPLA